MKKLYVLILISLFVSRINSLNAQTPVINLQLFSAGYTNPLALENCGDSRLFIVQQTGYIYISDSLGNKNPTPFLDVHSEISTGPGGERGLLGLAFHPDYLNNGYFYVYYTKISTGALRIVRFSVDSLNPNVADPASEVVLMEIAHPTNTNHNGGCLKFGPDSYLYAGTGDGGGAGDTANNAQNTKKYLGKLLRLDVDNGSPYAIPPDNPFVDDSLDYYPEIWAYGLRNPWRYSFDQLTGDLWIGDVGQYLWEEIDYTMHPDTGGHNYGWHCYEGNHTYTPGDCNGSTGLTFPVYEYPHTSGSDGDCTVTGGYVYRGAQYANMYGKYFFVDYCSGKISATTKNNDGTFTTTLVGNELISGDEFNFASFGEDRYGELYLTGVTDGKIYSLIDTACKPTAVIAVQLENQTVIDSVACISSTLQTPNGVGLNYQWQFNGSDIAGATSSSWVAADTGIYTVQVTNLSGCSNISSPVTVGAITTPSFSGLEPLYCAYQSPVTLTGDPSGGTFTGDGISENIFDPAAAGVGSHIITYTYTNEYGCSASQEQTTMVDACTGINEVWEDQSINIYPNPGNGIFTVVLENENDNITDLTIWNVSGQLLTSLDFPSAPSKIFTIDASTLSDGIYFLRMNKGSSIIWKKIIIAKQR